MTTSATITKTVNEDFGNIQDNYKAMIKLLKKYWGHVVGAKTSPNKEFGGAIPFRYICVSTNKRNYSM